MSYYRWSTTSDVPLFLDIARADGIGLTGSDPQVTIRRYKSLNGGLLDNFYWNGSTFISSPTSASMAQVDPVNQPGSYVYTFNQSLVQTETIYSVTYKHNAVPIGFVSEYHYFVSGSAGSDGVTVNVYESEVD